MHPYVQASLRAFIWSIAITLVLNHLTNSLNPFLGSVVLLMTLVAVVLCLVWLRKKGLQYVGAFLLGLIVFTSLFMALDNGLFEHSRRYYAIE